MGPGTWDLGIHSYSWEGLVVREEIGREGTASQKGTLDYLDGERRQKRKMGTPKVKPYQDEEMGYHRGKGAGGLDCLAKRRKVKATTFFRENRTR